MPVKCHYEYEDGSIREFPELVHDQVRFFPDYKDGRLNRIIGVSCLAELTAVVYVIDEAMLEIACRANLTELTNSKTIVDRVSPGQSGVIEDLTDLRGAQRSLFIKQILPFTQNMN
jgi:hypothetical protein